MGHLHDLALHIYKTAEEHGFWPDDREKALAALDRLGDAADAEGDYSQEWEIVRQYIQAQEIRNMGEMLMLATSELAECLEEHRDGKPFHYYSYKYSPSQFFGNENLEMMSDEDLEKRGITKKPEGVAVELADCIIRCLDTMRGLGVDDIDAIVKEKMRYNDGRPHKHGKAY